LFSLHDNSSNRNPFGSQEQNQSQQPGAGESQNTSSPPFPVQGNQPPRVAGSRRGRVQQNRYAVPTTMHYSESSQAEAGQQIDRLRHMNQPVPSALFNENPDVASNPSNSQNVPPVSSEGGNDPMTLASGSNDDVFGQLPNGQQDSAQPGVPATNHPATSEDNANQEVEGASNNLPGTFDLDSQERDEPHQEDTLEQHDPIEEVKENTNIQDHHQESTHERQRVEDSIRPNHQEELELEVKEDSPYQNKVRRQNEQSSPSEKNISAQDNSNQFNSSSRRQSNGTGSNQPFGYNVGQQRSGNYGSFVIPNSFNDNPPYMSQRTGDGSQYSSAYSKTR